MHTRKTENPTAGFTLAELLAVITVIGIVLLIGLPALLNLSNTSRLDAAAGALQSAIRRARQHALTHNQPTYLLFTDQHTADTGRPAYRAYALFTINLHTPAASREDGLFLSEWQSLPEGVVFSTTDDRSNVFSTSTAGEWRGGFNRNARLQVQGATYRVLGFPPQGTDRAAAERTLEVAEGFYTENGALVRTAPAGVRIHIDGGGHSRITPILYPQNDEPAEP